MVIMNSEKLSEDSVRALVEQRIQETLEMLRKRYPGDIYSHHGHFVARARQQMVALELALNETKED